ncbi:alpha/beta hydrolase fold domain-containing protein [Sphingomonas sp.]|uniref:alpha/beta hydrolase fold domain-containing protein n=1 Tax=Sphingomonas sp. TaxID=28214 RepID=UPI003D6D868D
MTASLAALGLGTTTGAEAKAVDQAAASATATPCPRTPPPPGMPGRPPIPMATSIKPSDTSTSIVIKPDPADQIECGRTKLKVISDIAFAQVAGPAGQPRNLALDILAPTAPGTHPLVIYVTGGGFVIAAKENALNLRSFVAENGFVVASVQYRTAMDGANYRDGVADVKSAIRFLRAHAADYGIDPTRVAVWGESAGGYLAAMVGVTNGVKDFDLGDNLDQSSAVQAVVDKFGTSDTAHAVEDFNPEMAGFTAPGSPITRYMTEKGTSFPPASNPLTYIGKSDPPFLIFHGSQDRIVSPSQTLRLHNALRAAGVPSTRYVLDGAGHGDLAFAGDPAAGLPWSSKEAMNLIVHFLHETK